MNSEDRRSAIDSLSRVTRHFLLLTLLLSSVAFGGGVDRALSGGALTDLPSQLDHVAPEQVALIGQQDALRAFKRCDHDDSGDAPWLHPATTELNLPDAARSLCLFSCLPAAIAAAALCHTPRAPPTLS